MKSTLVVRLTTITCLVFLLFTIVLSASGASDSKAESNVRVVRSTNNESEDDLMKYCQHFCSNNLLFKKGKEKEKYFIL
ncbi:unnamed protein product [Rotaria magnacalcarata]|uniref:Uncharacterized protein n=1 Tax=Rotaria magnacalcarata TaxID=392030 RepID=A0A819AQG6_9BILA|nr:unnamed protein product [Rotaria magnacalcarata]CAF3789464.1 unnamed protein product [Rotaria magnacalcarata]